MSVETHYYFVERTVPDCERLMDYTPSPIDSSGVTLDAEVQGLIEQLSVNVHEVWASQRLKDGWVFGAERDDARKTHPSLIPFDALPESEKDYDRIIVTQTIKALVALGYVVRRDESRPAS